MLLLLQIQQHHRDLEVVVDVDPVVDKRTRRRGCPAPTTPKTTRRCDYDDAAKTQTAASRARLCLKRRTNQVRPALEKISPSLEHVAHLEPISTSLEGRAQVEPISKRASSTRDIIESIGRVYMFFVSYYIKYIYTKH
jgi:hypothetical protein